MKDKKLEERLKLEYGCDSIAWEEMAKRYEAMYPDINIEEYFDRLQMKLEDGEAKDIQSFAREVEKNIKQYRKKISPKAGQKYPSPRTDKVVQALFKYWDDDLPLGDTRKTYFQKLAGEYELSFDRVVQIESEWRPDSFKPKR